MSVHRLAKYQTADPFTRVPNAVIRDGNLDLKALGLLVVMLSKPDGWRFTERNLANEIGVGRAQLRTAMGALIDAGYVVRHHEHDGERPIMVTKVYDTPQPSEGAETEPSGEVRNPEGPVSEHTETGPGSNEVGVVTKENPETTDQPSPSPATADDQQPDPYADWPEHVRALTREFAQMVQDNGHPLPSRGSKAGVGWLREMDRLLRLGPPGDGGVVPDEGEVRAVMVWALTVSDFWPAQIRSVPKFREQFSRLRLQARQRNGRARGADLARGYTEAAQALRERAGREG